MNELRGHPGYQKKKKEGDDMASKMLECADGAVCVTRFKNPPCPLEDRARANQSDEKQEQTRTGFISSLQWTLGTVSG